MKTMRILWLSAGLALYGGLHSQKQVHLQFQGAEPFRVFVNDKAVNDSAQAEVTLEDVVRDTLLIKVEVKGGARYGVTLYLLDKGKKTDNREFSYLLRKEKNRVVPIFHGSFESRPPKK